MKVHTQYKTGNQTSVVRLSLPRCCLLLEVAAPIHRGQATLFMAPLSVIATSPIRRERARGGRSDLELYMEGAESAD